MATLSSVAVVGAGLAGSEAALQLAHAGFPVTLYDIKPHSTSPAHHEPTFAEIVCSNSLGSLQPSAATGQLKNELRQLGCYLLALAQSVAVPAGNALAVDRNAFSNRVTQTLYEHPNITLVCEEVTQLPPADIVIIATGPLTTPALAQTISQLIQRQQLFFFDAASPIVTFDSIDMNIAFFQDRYNKTLAHATTPNADTPGSYINCPLNQSQYETLVNFLNTAEKVPLKDFEQTTHFFESCVPVDELARRGMQTLRYGPLKPKGLHNPHPGTEKPYAVVQLRQDNLEGTLYNLVGFQTNLKWGPQAEMIRLIPGLEAADVVRYGVMHRNTYLHSPEVLQPTLQLKKHPHVFIAGQLTGTEGYTESIATGLWAGQNAIRLLQSHQPLTLPKETMLGALLHYITRPEACGKDFQPINSNWGIVPPLSNVSRKMLKDKQAKGRLLADQANQSLAQWLTQHSLSSSRCLQPTPV
ncbi:MAG: methylenetetrahydrofolate--tRNA-(uracil(54)-C(5))-methyltransferase (FADH(2)-oxidizing) TrmFO [Vampirovibrionales bacterium]